MAKIVFASRNVNIMSRRTKRDEAKRPQLSRLELSVMDVVWDLQPCSSAEVIAAFRKRRKLAATTIKTVLANLRNKEYLEPVPTIERGFRLKATVSRAAVGRRSLTELLKNLFQGSPRQVILCLLKEERLSEEDVEEIRRLLESRESAKKAL
jgi:BlaI family transcriptional regulator, penicillinase repressor